MKIVDDTIIWANPEAQLEESVTTVLQRFTDNNITISRKKFDNYLLFSFDRLLIDYYSQSRLDYLVI